MPQATATISDLISKIISAGPKAQEALIEVDAGVTDFRNGIGHIQQAGVIMFGRSAATERSASLTTEEEMKVEELVTVISETEGVSAERAGVLSNLFAFIKAHPELISLFLSFLK